VTRKRTFYRLGNEELSAKLYTLVHRAVQARADLAWLRAERDRLQDLLDESSHESGTAAPYGIVDDLKKVKAWLAANEGRIDLLYDDIHQECPLAALAVPLLSLPFTRPGFEQILGEVMAQFHGESERIGRAFTDRISRVQAAVPEQQPGRPLERLYAADFSVEEAVVSAALDNVVEDPGQLSLLSEATIAGIVGGDGGIQRDSVEYVVLSHYLRQLRVELAVRERQEQRIEDFFGLLVKASALLSLALWAAPAGRVAKGVSAALGMGLVAYQAHSVVHQLALLDFELSKQMVVFDRQNAAAAVELTELALMRPAYLNELTQTIVTELVLIAAAGAWPEFKQYLHLRGYYLDLETLIGV
jgi:hypothetical protein